ncbi:LapA family protein, partial [Pseudonocardia pini]|uniref:LapA family protein n=1 Tax=Pseudonocardia pini TaxID=2758030 RepID=UPI0015F0BBAE
MAVPTEQRTTPPRRAPKAERSRISGMWVGLILSAVVLLFLLIFILQNLDPVQIHFLGLNGTLPTGVALLFGAIAGILLVAIPGSARIVQLRRAA